MIFLNLLILFVDNQLDIKLFCSIVLKGNVMELSQKSLFFNK